MAPVSIATPLASSTHSKILQPNPQLTPSKVPPFSTKSKSKSTRLQFKASFKEKAVTGLPAAALTASMVVPQVAEAADSGISPSLKNFLLSILAGGVVLALIVGAVIAVANFDPVKRR